MKDVTTKKSAVKYFVLLYAFSAPLWIIQVIIDVRGLPLDIPITDIIAAFMPMFVACFLIYREEGREGVKELFKRIFDYSRITNKVWYLAIFLVPLLIFLTIYAVISLANLPTPNSWNISLLSIPLLFVFFFLGSLGEEVGYMGYAFEPIYKKWNALTTAIVIGIPWAIWHYPSMINQGRSLVWILWGTLGTVAARILIVWIYNNTGKSLFACILFHALYNLGRVLFPSDEIYHPLVDYPQIHYSVIILFAAVVTIFFGTGLKQKKDSNQAEVF